MEHDDELVLCFLNVTARADARRIRGAETHLGRKAARAPPWAHLVGLVGALMTRARRLPFRVSAVLADIRPGPDCRARGAFDRDLMAPGGRLFAGSREGAKLRHLLRGPPSRRRPPTPQAQSPGSLVADLRVLKGNSSSEAAYSFMGCLPSTYDRNALSVFR